MIPWTQKTSTISKVMKYNEKAWRHPDLQNCSVLLLQVILSGTEHMDFPVKWFSVVAALGNLLVKYNYLGTDPKARNSDIIPPSVN